MKVPNFLQARLPGDSALCGVRPETLSLDSAAFEKAGETFNMRSARKFGESHLFIVRPDQLPDGFNGGTDGPVGIVDHGIFQPQLLPLLVGHHQEAGPAATTA